MRFTQVWLSRTKEKRMIRAKTTATKRCVSCKQWLLKLLQVPISPEALSYPQISIHNHAIGNLHNCLNLNNKKIN